MKNLLLLVLSCIVCDAGKRIEVPEFKFEGLKIAVHNLREAKQFYGDILGFRFTENEQGILLQTGSFPIQLSATTAKNTVRYHQHTRVSLTLQVPKLLPAIDRLRKKGLKFLESDLQRNGVGISIPFTDPSGNILHLIEVQVGQTQPIKEIQIYNTGVTSGDMGRARTFYQEVLGFSDWSTAYLPAALPLKNPDQSFAFMLHYRKGLIPKVSPSPEKSQMALVFTTKSLKLVKSYLESRNVRVEELEGFEQLAFQDPFGNLCFVEEA